MEGTLRVGIARHGIARSADDASLEVSSRTDRGVSAVGNVLAISSDLSGRTLLRSLNGISRGVFFSAAIPCPEGFRVRRALRRTYRYFEPARGHDVARWQSAARLFSGMLDVRSLGRGLDPHSPVWRTVESVRVEDVGGGLLRIETRAPSYVWGMVRKIVGALREVDAGRLTPSRLAGALSGRERLTLPLAEPERLLLWDVDLGLAWEHRWTGPNRHQARYWEEGREALSVRDRVLASLSDREASPPAARA